MKILRLSLLAFAAAGLVAAQGTVAPPKTHLKVGDTAPDFELPSTTGKTFKLSDFRGKKNVVVAFFPAAFTGG
ncbi:MAG TPA: redoxin domain-containing protein [Bryobacteraceae bacterium]|nr:redoxin domain-containing protein [Bryobacteraceae bacterium]